MLERKVDPELAGQTFSPFEFSWGWETTQLLARAAGGTVSDELDRPWMMPAQQPTAHPMILFNGAVAARNRPELMECLIGGYDNWQAVGRWGAGYVQRENPAPAEGRARVFSSFSEVGATSKGHALVRFNFDIDDVASELRLMSGWMLMFLLGCGSPEAGKLVPPRIAMPESSPDRVIRHETTPNVTFDWAVPSGDWNTTHFVRQEGNPAPLTHGPRNMSLVLQDAAREFAEGDLARVQSVTLGAMTAPHYPTETTETRFWQMEDGRILGRLVVPGDSRRDSGDGEKTCIDQIAIEID